jgi:AcrR family transcriptional regulator
MSSKTDVSGARAPKRARGKQRVAELLQAAAAVFAAKGYEAATMTEIAARADAPIGSLYQFFPTKESLADTLVENYVSLLVADLEALEASATDIDTRALVESLFGLLRAHPHERAAALPLAETRMNEHTRRTTFPHMIRKHIAAILRARTPGLSAEAARDTAIVVLQLMKAANMLHDEENLLGRVAALREIQALAVRFLEQQENQRTA